MSVVVGNGYVAYRVDGLTLYKVRDIRRYAWELIRVHIKCQHSRTYIGGSNMMGSSLSITCLLDKIIFDFGHTTLSIPIDIASEMSEQIIKHYET